MKSLQFWSLPLVAFSVIPVLIPSQTNAATVITDDFSSNTLTNYTNPAGGRVAFTYDATNERLNGGTTGNDRSSIAHNTSFGNFGSDTGFRLRFDFLTAPAGGNTAINFANVARLGFSSTANTFSNDGIGFELEIRAEQRSGGSPAEQALRLRGYGSGGTQFLSVTNALIPKFADGTWHTVTLEVVSNGTLNGFDYLTKVTTQADPATTIDMISGNTVSADVTNAAGLFAGFGTGINGNSGGSIAADNFSVVPIPEPSVALLAGIGSLLICRRRR